LRFESDSKEQLMAAVKKAGISVAAVAKAFGKE
jgi:transposase-like protein